MAAGTFAKIADSEQVIGKVRAVMATYTGNAAYTAGGDAVPGNMGLRAIRGVVMLGQNTASIGVVPVWNTQTGKLQLFQQAAGAGAFAEFSGNASTFVYTLMIISTDD